MRKRFLFILVAVLSAVPVSGQGRYVLTDGIDGRDRAERSLFLLTFSARSDTSFVVSDSLGRFEVDPDLMSEMRGNVYLKPVASRPKPKLTLVNSFDSIDFYRRGRERCLAQNLMFETEREDDVFFFDPDVTILKEATVKARRSTIGRDKVTGYLDSLTISLLPEWVCEHGYLNDYQGCSHHPEGCSECQLVAKQHMTPKRGEIYGLVKYEPVGVDGHWYLTYQSSIIYPGPQYTEEQLLEMNGMWKAQGYHPVREFYEPDELDLASATPDFRNLLLWRPAVLTDENGVAEIPFAASDVNTEFVGLVEAVDGTGLLGCRVFTFRVVKE